MQKENFDLNDTEPCFKEIFKFQFIIILFRKTIKTNIWFAVLKTMQVRILKKSVILI